MRASSPLMYLSALTSTSAMLACGFLEMENIKSFDCILIPTMNAVIVNFSSGISTLRDSGHKTSGFLASSALWSVGGNLASCMFLLQ